jgi:tetratricopeptide (TPR) repeat protein
MDYPHCEVVIPPTAKHCDDLETEMVERTDLPNARFLYSIALSALTMAAFLGSSVGQSFAQDEQRKGGVSTSLDATKRPEPDNARAYLSRGLDRADRGDLDGAQHDFSRAMLLSPDFVDALKNRGVVRAGQGDLDGALADSSQAIRLKPGDAQAFYNRGIARANRGDLDSALEDLDEAIRLNPGHVQARENRARLLRIKARRADLQL